MVGDGPPRVLWLFSAAKRVQHWYREVRREKWSQIYCWSAEWGRFEERKRAELTARATEATKLQKGARVLAAIIVPQVPIRRQDAQPYDPSPLLPPSSVSNEDTRGGGRQGVPSMRATVWNMRIEGDLVMVCRWGDIVAIHRSTMQHRCHWTPDQPRLMRRQHALK